MGDEHTSWRTRLGALIAGRSTSATVAPVVPSPQAVEALARSAALDAFAQAFKAGTEGAFQGGLPQYRRAGYTCHALTYACLSRIATAVAAVPFRLYRQDANGDETEVVTHPILDLLNSPHPTRYADGRAFTELIVLYLLASGNAWIEPSQEKNSRTKLPRELVVYGSNAIRPELDTQGELRAWISTRRQRAKRWQPDELFHLKLPNPDDELQILGAGPLQAAQTTLDADFARQAYDEAFFKHGAEPGAVLRYTPEQGMPRKLTRDDIADVIAGWNDTHQGADKAHRVAVLNAGFSLEKYGMSQKDMEFIQGRLHTIREVGYVFGVPAPLLNDFEHAGLGREGVEIAKQLFYEQTIVPYCDRLGSFWQRTLVEPYDATLTGRFDTEAIPSLRENLSSTLDNLQKLVTAGYSPQTAANFLQLGIDAEPWSAESFISVGLAPASAILESATAPVEEATSPPTAAPVETPEVPAEEETPPPESPAPERMLRGGTGRWPTRLDHWRAFVVTFARLERLFGTVVKKHFFSLRTETLKNLKAWAEQTRGMQDDITSILFDPNAADEDLKRLSRPYLQKAITVGSTGAADELGVDAIGIKAPRIEAEFERRAAKVTRINETVRASLRDTLAEGFQLGEALDGLAERVRQAFNELAAPYRTRMIARTEIAQAVNAGRMGEMIEQGVEEIEWLSQQDEAVRASHKALDGDRVRIGETFSNGLKYPGDPDVDKPEEQINCRCTVLPY